MKTLRKAWMILRSLLQRRSVKQDIDEELRFHIEKRVAENIAAGMSPAEAARDARRRFGQVQSIREECREARSATFGETLIQDTRFGLRMLGKNPGFTAVSVLSLAVGIAVNVAVFSCLNALVFRPPPGVRDPERLVYLHEMSGGMPYAEFEFLRDHASVFSVMAASAPCQSGVKLEYASTASATDTPMPRRQTEYLTVRFVSGTYFSLIGTEFKQGRGFLSEEDRSPDSHPVLILSQLFWKRHFNSDPALVGQTVTLNTRAYTVVGIAPENCPREPGVFNPPDAWVPFMMQNELDPGQSSLQPNNGSSHSVQFYGRLKPGVTEAQAETALEVLDDQFAKEFFDPKERREHWPSYLECGFTFLPTRPWEMKALILLILSISGTVLLIACANVASLLLARATARQREMGVRLALGASRLRLVRQLVTESLIIACLGGALGLLAGIWAGEMLWPRLVVNVLPPGLGKSFNFGLDWRTIGYAIVLTLATGVIFGLAPALEATKASLHSALKEESMLMGQRFSRSRLRSLLIVTQMAISLAFLISTTLMLRRVQTGVMRKYGFETERVLLMDFSTPAEHPREFQQSLVEKIEAIPGVRSDSLAQVWYARYLLYQSMRVDGQVPGRASGMAQSKVTPNYFATLGIPFVRGRNFTEEEAKMEAPVVIVSQSFAKQFWPGRDPIGHRLKTGATNVEAEVVGVVKDGVREIRSQYELQSYAGDFYTPLSPATTEKSEVWIRTEGNPNEILPILRRGVPSLDSTVRFGARRLSDMAIIWVKPMLFLATAVGFLGALALLLASVGVYGVVAYAAKQKTQEIGIRMALGAQREGILRLVIWEGMRLVVIGMVIGLIASACLSFVLRSYFYGLSPIDPVTFLGVSVVLATSALLACYFPARRATKVNPMVALRYE
jgi:predicted permease